MGIKERHERDREAVRRAILDAARELFVSESYNNVSIRKIAERIEYSPAAIYSYFPSKDDIFFELAEEGFRLLSDPTCMSPADGAGQSPVDRLRAMFWRLYEFSRDYPQYFALMFVDRNVPRITRPDEASFSLATFSGASACSPSRSRRPCRRPVALQAKRRTAKPRRRPRLPSSRLPRYSAPSRATSASPARSWRRSMPMWPPK